MVLLNRAALVLLALAACRPDLTERQSVVSSPRILAIRSEPAEVEAHSPVSLEALVVDPSGNTPPFVIDWAMCVARKPLAELEPVDPRCTARSGDFLVPLGQGTSASGTIPSDACRLFGPEVPAPKPGEPYGRPTDPDTTGGYYLPVRVILAADGGDELAMGSPRLSCGVAGASSGDATDFRAHYHVNSNPIIASLVVNGAPAAADDASATPVKAGSVAHFEIDWPACPAIDACGDGICGPDETSASCAAECGDSLVGCGGAERYFFYDTEAQHDVTRRESMRASWFTTAGSYAVDITGREQSDPTPSTTNELALPDSPQIVHGWVVLRDSRGGTTWRKFALNVQ